jgi:hypothetical protein
MNAIRKPQPCPLCGEPLDEDFVGDSIHCALCGWDMNDEMEAAEYDMWAELGIEEDDE